MLLTTGGDERIWLHPVTRRNRYGVGAAPAAGEIWFSSSTATAISESGFLSAQYALGSLTASGSARVTLPAFFDDVRRRLLAIYGAPGSDVVLVPSGTEGELLTLSVAMTLMPGPITNIVVAPAETGSGVLMAAGGTSFQNSSSLGAEIARGDRLEGLADADIAVETVPIRDEAGRPRTAEDIDAESEAKAVAALSAGRNVILHVLDTSKTGLAGLSRPAAAALRDRAPERVMVVVDACQLRCSSEQIREDQAAGFAVLVTGSKFAGGPPFCGALIMPRGIVGTLRGKRVSIAGLASFSALHDWSEELRPSFAPSLSQTANLGLGLRWVAALEAIERYEAIDPDLRDAIADRFNLEVTSRITRSPHLARLEDHDRFSFCPTIVPFVVQASAGAPAGLDETIRIHESLRAAGEIAPIHLGQAVALGRENALRVCASMQHIDEVATLYAKHRSLAEAFTPLLGDLDLLFDKLERMLAEQRIAS